MTLPPTTPWHLGPVHPVEQALTVVLALGPFLVLGVVVWLRRRADAREEVAAGEIAAGEIAADETAAGGTAAEPYER